MTTGTESNWGKTFGPRHAAWASAAAIGGAAGYFQGGAVIDGICLVWNGWLMPTFIKIYLYGVALCA